MFEVPQLDRLDQYLCAQLPSDHLLDKLARELLNAGGKRIRARLTIDLARHLNVSDELTWPWAAAMEFLHTASLVHDDIQDQDHYRRGRKTLWLEHGTDVAISVGDYLLMKPFAMVSELNCSSDQRLKLTQNIAQTVSQMALAQVQERALLNWTGHPSLNEHYMRVVDGKTSALFELPVRGLAIMARMSEQEQIKISYSFRVLGRFFQIWDDLKDIYCLKGKPLAGTDLREGKVSALVCAYIGLRPERAEALRELLQGRDATPLEIASWVRELDQSGACDQVEQWLLRLWQEFESGLPAASWTREFCAQLAHALDKRRLEARRSNA